MLVGVWTTLTMARLGHGDSHRAVSRLDESTLPPLDSGVAFVDIVGGEHSRLEDPAALAEINLYGDLVIAASSSDSALSALEIDQVLGVAGTREEAQPKRPVM